VVCRWGGVRVCGCDCGGSVCGGVGVYVMCMCVGVYI
jgi:hypothetical protein